MSFYIGCRTKRFSKINSKNRSQTRSYPEGNKVNSPVALPLTSSGLASLIIIYGIIATPAEWRNQSEFISGREEVKVFLANKWENELDYKLNKRTLGIY
ncbi:DUF1348 family protein [Pedobacter ginsengiterrae]|uniref:DUF1348 family protein n=1 Tax=Pedobacter ginsengiterrae TaxID=871696 RepID=UPI0031E303A3